MFGNEFRASHMKNTNLATVLHPTPTAWLLQKHFWVRPLDPWQSNLELACSPFLLSHISRPCLQMNTLRVCGRVGVFQCWRRGKSWGITPCLMWHRNLRCHDCASRSRIRALSVSHQKLSRPLGALGTAMATVRQAEPLPWLWTVYSVPCLCPAREGAGLPQPGSLLTWYRVYLSYSVGSFIASWKLCHLSLGIIVCAPPPKGWIVATDGWQIFLSAPVWTYFHAGWVTVRVTVPFLHISLFHASVPCFSRLIEKGAQREESPSNSSWLCWEPPVKGQFMDSHPFDHLSYPVR